MTTWRSHRALVVALGATLTVLAGLVAWPPAVGAIPVPIDSIVTTTDDLTDTTPHSTCGENQVGGVCSLREAVWLADVSGGGNITFGIDGVFELEDEIDVSGGFTISVTGNGVGKTILDADFGESYHRHFKVSGAATELQLEGMTLRNGANEGGGSVWVTESGALRTTDVHFVDNEALGGGAILADANFDTVDVRTTTFTGNSAQYGGAIYIDNDTASIYNSTFSGNSAAYGAALYLDTGATVSIQWTTISQNDLFSAETQSAVAPAGVPELGGSILTEDGADLTVSHSIVEQISDGDECVGFGNLTSEGANVVDDESCGFTEALDQQGVAANAGSLQDNGGPTFTMALTADSPSVDVDPEPCKLNDQRGLPRNVDGDGDGTAACDSGAYELQPAPPEEPPPAAQAAQLQPTFTG